MIHLKLRHKERTELEWLIGHTHDARLLQRAQAILWFVMGESIDAIALRLLVSRQSVYNWFDRFRERDSLPLASRLTDAARSGRPRTAHGIIDPLLEAVIETDPRELGYRSTVWTAGLLQTYLSEEHQIAVSAKSISFALARLQIRWKRPRHQLLLRAPHWRQAKGGSNAGSRSASGASS